MEVKMKVFREDSEKQLLSFMETHMLNPKNKRCLVVKLNKEQQRLIFSNPAFFNLLEEKILDENARSYVCKDGEVFVFFAGVPLKDIEALKSDLAVLLNEPSAENNITLHDFAHEAYDLILRLKAKIKALNENQKELENQKAEFVKNNATAILNAPIAEELVNTLAARKQKRGQPLVMVIEDDVFSCRLVRNSLNKDHEICTINSGIEGIEQYFIKAPNILFLDINLPDISGHDILSKILRHDKGAFVVMLSGNNDKDNVINSVRAGAKGFISKPFTREKLLQYIGMAGKESANMAV